MRTLSPRQKRAIAGIAAASIVLLPALWIARSPSLRASLHAARLAFEPLLTNPAGAS